jgi:predicted ATPase
VVGAQVMGKTTVAAALAHALLDDFDTPLFFADLSTLNNAALLAFVIVSALGFHVPVHAQDAMAGRLGFLGGRRDQP